MIGNIIAALIMRGYLATFGQDACTAYQAAWADMHAIGACSFDTEIEDGECTQEASDALQALFFECHPADRD